MHEEIDKDNNKSMATLFEAISSFSFPFLTNLTPEAKGFCLSHRASSLVDRSYVHLIILQITITDRSSRTNPWPPPPLLVLVPHFFSTKTILTVPNQLSRMKRSSPFSACRDLLQEESTDHQIGLLGMLLRKQPVIFSLLSRFLESQGSPSLLTIHEEVDMAAQTVEKIADAVEKVAEEVDKAAEDLAEALPEGGLKKVVTFVEDLAEETAKDAQMVEDLMDKVEELDDKLESFLNKQFKGTDKA